MDDFWQVVRMWDATAELYGWGVEGPEAHQMADRAMELLRSGLAIPEEELRAIQDHAEGLPLDVRPVNALWHAVALLATASRHDQARRADLVGAARGWLVSIPVGDQPR